MAEGWAGHLKSDKIEAVSAGTRPKGIHPVALEVMKEAGVDITGQQSTHIDAFEGRSFDFVITLCGSAHESCPLFPGETRVVHHGFDDPDDPPAWHLHESTGAALGPLRGRHHQDVGTGGAELLMCFRDQPRR